MPLATVPVGIKLKSTASTPVTELLKRTIKLALVVAEAPLLPVSVVMEIAVGNAGENGAAGTILCSRLRSSSLGRPEALRAFLFGELLKSLRKAFKSMEKFLIPKPKIEANRRAMCIGGAAKV